MTACSSAVGGTAAMGTNVRLSALRVIGWRLSLDQSKHRRACATNGRRQLYVACVIRPPTIGNPANRTAELLGKLESQVRDTFVNQTEKRKTYNSGYSLVVTHLTTNPPVRCLNRAERTGSLVFNVLWSYVTCL